MRRTFVLSIDMENATFSDDDDHPGSAVTLSKMLRDMADHIGTLDSVRSGLSLDLRDPFDGNRCGTATVVRKRNRVGAERLRRDGRA